MKIFRGISIFLILLATESCFEPPEFPSAPQLTFDDVEFVDTDGTDSLVIYISFRDGDGDLGLDPSDITYISYPYHSQYFFQADGNGGMDSLATFAAVTTSGTEYHIIDIPNPAQGKLIFERTRKQPQYAHLPSLNCQNYESLTEVSNVLVDEADLAALDQIAINNIIDTLHGEATRFFQIRDTLYRKTNLDHFNLEIHFYQFNDATSEWEEFDWGAPPFCQTFHMRFPFLSDNPGRALEGFIRYAMPSIGFKNLFSLKRLKLRVAIKDRARNRSNVVESREFTLQDITVGGS